MGILQPKLGRVRGALPWALALTILSVSAAPPSVTAGVDASNQRGFQAGRAYQFGELDAISSYNGNLTITLPVGLSYPVGPGWSYQMKLVYNSQIWDYTYGHSCVIGNAGPTWFGQADQAPDPCETDGQAHPLANAGLGWQLHFGYLVAPFETTNPDDPDDPSHFRDDTRSWVYVAPDGGSHVFWQTLHGGGNATAAECAAPPCYTRDGSYLRLRTDANGDYVVEHPNGLVDKFQEELIGGLPTTRWALEKREDRFGNWMAVEIVHDLFWRVTDSHQREHHVIFAPPPPGVEHPRRVVKDVYYQSPAGTGTNGLGLVTLTYGSDDFNAACAGIPNTMSLNPQALLSSVETVGVEGGWQLSMQYHANDPTPGSSIQCSLQGGRLAQLTLPTDGSYRYDYGSYLIPRMRCRNEGENEPGTFNPPASHAFTTTVGVIRKTALDQGGNELGYWKYGLTAGFARELPAGVGSCQGLLPWGAIVRTSYGPGIGNGRTIRTDQMFSTWPHDQPSASGWSLVDTGLPFTREQRLSDPIPPDPPGFPDPTSIPPIPGLRNPFHANGHDYFLSAVVYECPLSDRDQPPANFPAYRDISQCQPFRAEYVRYERSFDGCSPDDGSCSAVQNRVAGTLSLDLSNGIGLWKSQDHSLFDGFGNYRQSVTGGNYPNFDPSNTVTTFTNYLTPGATGLPENPANINWLFGTYDQQTTTEIGKGSERREYCFDSRGFLMGERRLAGTAAGAHDVATFYSDPSGKGFVERVQTVGGDARNDGAADLCQSAPGAEYETRNTWAYGTLQSSWAHRGSAPVLRLEENTIDPTGLVVVTRDVAGQPTTWKYDVMGRFKESQDPAQAKIVVAYQTNQRQVEVMKYAGAALATTERYRYDSLGRLKEERRTVPTPEGNREVMRCMAPMLTGWEHKWTDFFNPQELVPVPTDCPPAPSDGTEGLWYRLDDFDPAGRARFLTAPDGAVTTTNYFGDQSKNVTVDVRGVTGTVRSRVESKLNRQGRLVKVIEDEAIADPGRQIRETTYEYDVGGRLAKVRQWSGTSPVQERRFTYDGRGFLLSEYQPEVGVDIGFPAHDTKGNVLRREYPGPSAFDLDYRYDAAGRLTQIGQVLGQPGQILLKEYFYGRYEENAPDYRAGRLIATKRRNPALARNGAIGAPIIITELFSYADPTGRVTAIETRSSDGGVFRMHQTHDPLGNLSSLDYPLCVDCSVSGPARQIAPGYSQGSYLTSIPGFVTSLSYHPTGMWARMVRAEVTDTLSLYKPAGTVVGLPLVGEITASNSKFSFSPGAMSYDAARNVTAIGTDVFGYDAFQQLVQADYGDEEASQTYTYDVFGNLIDVVSAGAGKGLPPSRAIPANATNNRLTGTHVLYDTAGNLRRSETGGATRDYDAFNTMVKEAGAPNVNREMVYNANDERVFVRDDIEGGVEKWTLRSPSNQVLRLFRRGSADDWAWTKDHVFAGGTLVAEVTPTAILDYHLDHLGSVRATTDAATGLEVGERSKHWPYGELVTNTEAGPNGEILRFTGHERDYGCAQETCIGSGARDDLDYMHARYYSPWLGRFLSVDPVRSNRSGYSYAAGNPVRNVDPDGRYKTDFHYDTTLFIADRLGLGPTLSRAIATATLAPDRDGRNPFRNFFFKFGGTNRLYHFPSSAQLQKLRDTAFSSGEVGDLGTYLHALQDSFSHGEYIEQGFHPTTAPDIIANDIPKALTAAEVTYREILAWAKSHGYEGDGAASWAEVEQALPMLWEMQAIVRRAEARRLQATWARIQERDFGERGGHVLNRYTDDITFTSGFSY